jgi:hypothetical protein
MLACSPPRDATRSFRWAARDQENWAWMPDNARLFASATPHEVKQRLHGGIMFAHQGRGSLAGFDNHGRNIHSELRLPFKKCLLPDRATGSTNNAFKAIALPDRATRTTKMLVLFTITCSICEKSAGSTDTVLPTFAQPQSHTKL